MNGILNVKLIKFGLVGMAGMAIDFGITWICKEQLRINKYIANSTGFICALTNNYLLNRYWTFAGTNSPVVYQFTKFLLVSLIGLGINNLLLYLFVKHTKYNFYLLKLCVIGIVFVWNYTANLLYTFH
jgi:putative flippase GtrA